MCVEAWFCQIQSQIWTPFLKVGVSFLNGFQGVTLQITHFLMKETRFQRAGYRLPGTSMCTTHLLHRQEWGYLKHISKHQFLLQNKHFTKITERGTYLHYLSWSNIQFCPRVSQNMNLS